MLLPALQCKHCQRTRAAAARHEKPPAKRRFWRSGPRDRVDWSRWRGFLRQRRRGARPPL